MEKKETTQITLQEKTSLVSNLQDAMENAILSEMDRLNIGLISFYRNGDYAEFDIDRAFCVIDNWENPYYCEVVAILKCGSRLAIVPNSNDLSKETLDILATAEIFPQGDMEDAIKEEDVMLIEETFMPTDTLAELCDSMLGITSLVKEPITERVNLSR